MFLGQPNTWLQHSKQREVVLEIPSWSSDETGKERDKIISAVQALLTQAVSEDRRKVAIKIAPNTLKSRPTKVMKTFIRAATDVLSKIPERLQLFFCFETEELFTTYKTLFEDGIPQEYGKYI